MFQLLVPTQNYDINQVFGARKEVYGGIGHTGVDFGTIKPWVSGDPIMAVDEGPIIRKSYDSDGYGNFYDQKLVNMSKELNADVVARYGHLQKHMVEVGDYQHMGDQIATGDNTGWSTGPHLHFEIRINGKPVDPLPYLTLTYQEFMNELQKLRQDNDNAYKEQNGRLDAIEQVNREQEERLDKQSHRINDAKEEAVDGNKKLRARVEKTIGKPLEKLTAEEQEAALA